MWQLNALPVTGVKGVVLRWSRTKVPFKEQRMNLANELNPLYARYRDEWMKTPDNILRWRVTTNTSSDQLNKEVLRRRLKRRWQAAFRYALKQRGFDHRGQSLRSVTEDGPKQPLTGTLEMLIHRGSGFHEEFTTLVSQADAIVLALMRQMRK